MITDAEQKVKDALRELAESICSGQTHFDPDNYSHMLAVISFGDERQQEIVRRIVTKNQTHSYDFIAGITPERTYTLESGYLLEIPEELINIALVRQGRSASDHYVGFYEGLGHMRFFPDPRLENKPTKNPLPYVRLRDNVCSAEVAPERNRRHHISEEHSKGIFSPGDRVVFVGLDDRVALLGYETFLDNQAHIRSKQAYVLAGKFFRKLCD